MQINCRHFHRVNPVPPIWLVELLTSWLAVWWLACLLHGRARAKHYIYLLVGIRFVSKDTLGVFCECLARCLVQSSPPIWNECDNL